MSFRRKISNICYMTKYFWRFGKKYLLFIFIGATLQALQLYTEVNIIALIINSLINNSFDQALYNIILYCVILLVCKLYSDFSYYYYPLLAAKVAKQMSTELMQKSMKIDFCCFDDAEYYNAYTRASSEADGRLQNLIGTYIGMVHSFFSIITITTLLTQINFYYLLVVLFDVIIALIIATKRKELEFKFQMDNTLKFRKLSYIKNLFFNPSVTKEIRIYGLQDFFLNKYNIEYDEYYKKLKNYNLKHESPAFVGTFVSYLCLFANMLLATYQVLKKSILPGTFMSTIVACNRLKEQMLSLLTLIPNLSQHALYIENMRKIFDYEPTIENAAIGSGIDTSDGIIIEFVNVSFKYPNSDILVLKNLNMKIDSRKKYVLVGENGAGKTTIVKLLLRLYDPFEGKILVNGIDLREINNLEWRKLFSVVFQDYNQYNIKLSENIAFSEKINEDKLNNVLADVDLLQKFKKSYAGVDSQLGRKFDPKGVVLSGGEAQRLSLARALYNESEILILDEPSSALDPIAEDRLIKTILEYSKNKIALVISHRLSLCKNMDMIYYLQDGKIIECGDHPSLMNLKGKYFDLFTIQAEKYRE